MPLTVISAVLMTQASHQLKFAPKVGSVLRYKSSQVADAGAVGGKTVTTMILTMKVLSFTAGLYKIEAGYSDVKVVGGKGPSGQADALNGKTVTYKINTRGVVTGGASGDKTADAMVNSLSSAGMGIEYPNRALKVGESWPVTVDLAKVMGSALGASGMQNKSTGSLKSTVKLSGVSGGKANLAILMKGGVSVSMGAPTGAKGGAPASMTMKISIDSTGTQSVDASAGTLINSNTKMKMVMSIMGQSVPVTLTSTMQKI